MQLIKKIEIQYFRSIYSTRIDNISDLMVLTGKNDVGKSNIIKALNLFFNNRVESENKFVFADNFNYRRLEEVRKDSVKGRQFIRIAVTFDCGSLFEKTLPRTFTVTKKWYRNDIQPSEIKNNIEKRMELEKMKYSTRSKTSLTQFLNRIHFYYIPAIKDREIFGQMIYQLRETIYNDSLFADGQLTKSLGQASEIVGKIGAELNQEFFRATGILSQLTTPERVQDVYKTMNVATKTEYGQIDLRDRGDGIQVRYIPSILNFISRDNSFLCIWGYEEPENSLEYNLALSMADDFCKFANKSQIFITTHSPAFIGLYGRDRVALRRCFERDHGTEALTMEKASQIEELSKELGYARLLTEQMSEYERKMNELEELRVQTERLQTQLSKARRPVVMTEGKTDVTILQTAWKKLYKNECPFDIRSCNVYPEDSTNSAAGCAMLAETLKTSKHDQNNIIVGMFDHDAEGLKSFQLDKNFVETSDGRWKYHKNGKAFAFTLPSFPERAKFYDHENLCIEYFFDDESLHTNKDGRCLTFAAGEIEERCGNKVLSKRKPSIESEFYLFYPVQKNKAFFAEQIVPELDATKFEQFQSIFEIILDILQFSSKSNAEQE